MNSKNEFIYTIINEEGTILASIHEVNIDLVRKVIEDHFAEKINPLSLKEYEEGVIVTFIREVENTVYIIKNQIYA